MRIYSGGDSFYQWDLNRKVTSKTLKVGDEVHSYSLGHPMAFVTIAYELDGVVVADIPNILLQKSYPITVYTQIETAYEKYTVNEYQFTVKQRVRPDDYVYAETEVLNYYTLERRIKQVEDSLSYETIAPMIAYYLEQNPIEIGSTAAIGVVELLSDKWVASENNDNLYLQKVSIDGVTENSQIDLTPSVEQLVVFYEKDLTFVTENDGGVVTVYAIGQKPLNDYTIQVTITEVTV